MEALLSVDGLISLLSLTTMEIILGIDNIVFISIICNRLPLEQRAKARMIGLFLALLMRILLLIGIVELISYNHTLISVFGFDFDFQDIIHILGGLFLIYRSTTEIHHKLDKHKSKGEIQTTENVRFPKIIYQIVVLDIVFSFDSILTAIGLVDSLTIMIIAVIIAIFIMLMAAEKISKFVNQHPTIEMLALAFLLLIGILFLVEAFHFAVPKGYVYFTIFFSLMVELLNIRLRKTK